MGFLKYLKESFKKTEKQRQIEYRKSEAVTKLEKPTRIDKARRLGYKAKKGFIIARVRLKRGGHKRSRPRKGRRSKRLTIRKNLKLNYQVIAEQRAARKFRNLEVLNSYQISKDGQHYFFEIILVDKHRPEIKADKKINWITKKKHTRRVFRGKTSAARKGRGIRKKGSRRAK